MADGWGVPEDNKIADGGDAWNANGLKHAIESVTNGHGTNGFNEDATKGTSDNGVINGGDQSVDEEKAAMMEKVKGAGWNGRVAYDYADLQATQTVDWESNARVYEWDGEHGDVGPELPELELELFGDPYNRGGVGLDFSK
jgi:hypothetical protein